MLWLPVEKPSKGPQQESLAEGLEGSESQKQERACRAQWTRGSAVANLNEAQEGTGEHGATEPC